MLVWVLFQYCPEERRAGGQDQLVCLDLPGTTTQGAVKKVFLFSDLPESDTDVALKIIPAKAKFLIWAHGMEVTWKIKILETVFKIWVWLSMLLNIQLKAVVAAQLFEAIDLDLVWYLTGGLAKVI